MFLVANRLAMVSTKETSSSTNKMKGAVMTIPPYRCYRVPVCHRSEILTSMFSATFDNLLFFLNYKRAL
jgi:hypothetical protein